MTAPLLVPLSIALLWAAVSGSFGPLNLGFGLVLGLMALWLVRDGRKLDRIRVRPLALARLAGLFLIELARSGVRVLILALSPRLSLRPAVVAVPLTLTRDFEITLLANLVTLTPGTLSIDLSEDRSRLFVHCLDAPDPDAVAADIRAGFERAISEAFR